MSLFIGELKISSPVISNLGDIPEKYTVDGGNQIPEIHISGAPAGTRELAVICHDPDAPLPHGFTHWTVYGIDADAKSINLAADNVREGPCGIGDMRGWSGPQPPVGHGKHHYYFWVYALNKPVTGKPTRIEFLDLYGDSIIEQARFVGIFER